MMTRTSKDKENPILKQNLRKLNKLSENSLSRVGQYIVKKENQTTLTSLQSLDQRSSSRPRFKSREPPYTKRKLSPGVSDHLDKVKQFNVPA
jgi:hypothetical protein